MVDKERMSNLTTEYREQSKKQDCLKDDTSKKLHQVFSQITAAGVSRYLDRPIGFENGASFKLAQRDDKIKDVWTKVDIQPHLLNRDNNGGHQEESESEKQER